MRTPWLLASILLHSVAAAVVLMLGVRAQAFVQRPVARIEIRNAPPSAPARVERRPDLEVQAETPRDAQPLVDVRVPPVEAPDPAPVIDAEPLPPSPSAVLSQATTERVRPPEPAPPPASVEPAPPVLEELPVAPAEPVYTAATRLKRGRDKPAYPQKERRLGREGEVVLSVSVRADGTVADAALKAPSRYAGFNRAALRAVRTWQFSPATQDGVAVECVIDVPVVFRLADAARR